MDCAISILKSSNDRKKHARLNATTNVHVFILPFSSFFRLEEKRGKPKNMGFRSFSTSVPSSAPSGDSSGTPWFVFHQQKARPSLGVVFCIFLHCFKMKNTSNPGLVCLVFDNLQLKF